MEVTRAAPPRSLAYAEITANQTGLAATNTVVTGLQVQPVATIRPMWVEMWIPSIKAITAGGLITVILTDATSSGHELSRWQQDMTAATNASPYIKRRFATLTPGTQYTFQIVASPASGGTLDIHAGTAGVPGTSGFTHGPAFIRAFEE